jgi:hypothetical protein
MLYDSERHPEWEWSPKTERFGVPAHHRAESLDGPPNTCSRFMLESFQKI